MAAPGDTWTIGNGLDTFYFDTGFGDNSINGFNPPKDILDFSRLLFENFGAVLGDIHQVGANTVIAYDSNDIITLNGVTASRLTASDFKFT